MEQICARWAKIGPKIGFLPFVKFSSLVFLEIIYNDSLQQCITSSWGKTHEKNWGGGGGANLDQNRLKLCLEVGFLPCLTTSRVKTHKKGFGTQILAKHNKLGPKFLGILSFSQVWFISFPLNCME